MGFLGLTNNITYNYTTINLLQILASQVRANVFLTWIISRWAKGTRNGPGVGSGCSAVSSQGEGPGLGQEWGKRGGSRKGSQLVLESTRAASKGTWWGFQGGLKWPRENPGKGGYGGNGQNRAPLDSIARTAFFY